jgi:hypothetical protein
MADKATAWREQWGERLDTAWEDGRADALGAELLNALGRGVRATALCAAAVAVGVAVGLPLLRPAYAATPSKPDATTSTTSAAPNAAKAAAASASAVAAGAAATSTGAIATAAAGTSSGDKAAAGSPAAAASAVVDSGFFSVKATVSPTTVTVEPMKQSKEAAAAKEQIVAVEAEQSASADSAAAAPVEQTAPPPAVSKTQAMSPAPPEKKIAPAKATFDPAVAASAYASTSTDAESAAVATMPTAAAASTAAPNVAAAGTSDVAATDATAVMTTPAKAQRRRALPAVSDPDQPGDASPAQLPGVADVGMLPLTLKDASQRTGPGLMQQAFTHEVSTSAPLVMHGSHVACLQRFDSCSAKPLPSQPNKVVFVATSSVGACIIRAAAG